MTDYEIQLRDEFAKIAFEAGFRQFFATALSPDERTDALNGVVEASWCLADALMVARKRGNE